MFIFISLAPEHWLVSGWIVITLLLSITQVEVLIDIVMETGKYHIYELFVISIVGISYLWIFISAIAVIEKIWLIF